MEGSGTNMRWGRDVGEYTETNSLSDFPPPSQSEFIHPLMHSSAASFSGGSDEGANAGGLGAEGSNGGGLGALPRAPAAPVADRSFRRPLPQPRPFEGTGERSIKNFFLTFERFATSMWGARKSDWVAGLEANLQGWALVLYRGLVDQGQPYEKIKKDLLTAFPGVVDPFRTKNLLKLVNLRREIGEPLPVFFQRIDQILRETYPDLTDESHQLQVRDTFLMKLDQNIALKIANFCNARGDFGPETVRESANLITLSDTPNVSTENIFLANIGEKMGAEAPGKVTSRGAEGSGLRCYICAGAWHPVSACSLYPMVFSCPLCRVEPHAVTECPLFIEWKTFRNDSQRPNPRQQRSWGESWQRSEPSRNQYEVEATRQRYQSPRPYPGRYDAGNYQNNTSRGEFRYGQREYRSINRNYDNGGRTYDNERNRDRPYDYNEGRFRQTRGPVGNQNRAQGRSSGN